MVTDSTYKAAKAADILQTVAKLVVLFVIIPAAVLLAVFFITEPFISDIVVRQSFSLSVALCLAGIIAARTERNVLGYGLILIGTALGTSSLSTFWNQAFMTMGCIHGALIIALVLVLDATSKEVIEGGTPSAVTTFLISAVIITGPLIGVLYLIDLGTSLEYILLVALLISIPYVVGLHYYQRRAKLGVFEAVLLSAALSLAFSPPLYANIVVPDMLTVLSAHILMFGIGLLVFSQMLRYIQTLVLERGARQTEGVSERKRIEMLMGIDQYTEIETRSQAPVPQTTKTPEIIDLYIAHAVSSLSLVLVASGIPAELLALAALSSFGESSWFLFLFTPLAAILSLLVVIPSAVFMRLGHYITRRLEEKLVKLLGLLTVLSATAASYVWSQFSLWPNAYSAILAAVVALSGVTGIFREVRKLWKRLWLQIVHRFRALKRWIVTHPVHTGAAVDSLLTVSIITIILPMLAGFEYHQFALVPLSSSIASAIAMMGLGAMKQIRNRMRFAAAAWVTLLCSNSLFTYWYLTIVLATEIISAVAVSLMWMLGSAALQKLETSRRTAGLAYLPGTLGVVWYLFLIEQLYLPMRYILPAIAALVLPAAILHSEYKRALVRAGITVYRAMTVFGALLVRFILVSYATLAIAIITYGSYSFLYSGIGLDFTYVLVIAGTLFFLSYSPVVKYRGMDHRLLVLSMVAGLAFFMGAMVYYLMFAILPRFQAIVLAVTTSLTILTWLRDELPKALRSAIPLVLWGTVLLFSSSLTYWWLSGLYEQSLAFAWTAAVISAYMLVSSRTESLKTPASIGYAITGLLACVLFWFSFGFSLMYLAAAVIIVLAPIAFDYYIRALRYMGRLALKLGEALLLLVLTYTVLAAAIIGLSISVVIITNLSWFFDVLFQPDLTRVVFAVLFTLSFSVPAVLRVEDFDFRIRSGILVLLSVVGSAFLLLLLPPLEPLLTILLGATALSLLLAAFSPLIPEISNGRYPLVLGLALLMGVGLYVAPFDLLLKILTGVAWTATVLGLAVEERVAMKMLYPVATTAVVAIFSIYAFLPITSPLMAAAFFIMLESLLLCIPESVYHPLSWAAFCISLGYFLYTLLAFFSTAALLVAAGVVAELLGRTPKTGASPEKLEGFLAALRTIWIGLFIAVQLTPFVGTIAAGELAFLAGLITLRVSWSKAPERVSVVVQDLIGVASTVLVYSWLSPALGPSIALHLALMPLFLVAVVHSQLDPFRAVHEAIVLTLVALYSITIWYLFYPVLEVVPLAAASGISSIFLLRWIRFENPKAALLTPISAAIFLLEAVWIWHAYFIFSFGPITIGTGAALLLLATLLIPATDSMEWTRFEFIWEGVSVLNALILGAQLSGWNLFQFLIPAHPLLTIGWVLSLYGLISAPVIHCAESKIGNLYPIGHISWSPSIPGWFLVAWSYTASYSDVHLRLAVSALAFSCAITPFLLLHPQRTDRYPQLVDISFASSLAYVAWALGGGSTGIVRIGVTLLVWYIIALPVTWMATVWGFNRAKEFATRHKTELAFLIPPLATLTTFATILTIPLDTLVRQLLFSIASASFVFGFLYYATAQIVEEKHRAPVLVLSLAGISTAVFAGPILLLSLVAGAEASASFFALSTSLAITLLTVSGLSRAFHFRRAVHPSHVLGGLFAGAAAFLGLTTLAGIAILESLIAAVFVTFLIEAPFLTEQIRAFLRLLADLGSLMLAALKRLNAFLRYIFDRFGYIIWVIFSSLVTLVIGTLSYPFFSELIGMQPGTLLYAIPSYSVPLGLFGLLLISIAAIRRGVQSPFGMSSIGVLITGMSLSAASFLIDRGLVIPALSGSWAMVFMSLTVFANHLDKDETILRSMFITVPISIALFFVSFFYSPEMSINMLTISVGLSLVLCFSLFVGSIRVGLASESLSRPLQVGIAFASALITYAVADFAFFALPCIYLSAFVMSWLLLPVARREHLHLFNAPLFFSLTGFGFTFVFGELIQGLLLAMAALLLFVSLYIRDRENENPQLVYARLIALLALIGCLVGFGVLTFMPSLL